MHSLFSTAFAEMLFIHFSSAYSCSELPESELMVKLHRKIRNGASATDIIPSSTGK